MSADCPYCEGDTDAEEVDYYGEPAPACAECGTLL